MDSARCKASGDLAIAADDINVSARTRRIRSPKISLTRQAGRAQNWCGRRLKYPNSAHSHSRIGPGWALGPSAELTRLNVSLSVRRGPHPGPRHTSGIKAFSHWSTVGD